ncbi:hypothetical protein JCM3765_002156 [Sporobolomyces pararoseus]
MDRLTNDAVQLTSKTKRILSVACAISSISLLLAIAFLVQLVFTFSTSGGNLVLLQVTIGILITVLCSGIVVNYARVQPFGATRLWSLAYSVISYLAILWSLLCALAFVVASDVLYPEICSSSSISDCDESLSSLAFNSFIAISLALFFSLVVHSILSYDLEQHVAIARAALAQEDLELSRQGYRQVFIVQTAYLPVSQLDPESYPLARNEEKGRIAR